MPAYRLDFQVVGMSKIKDLRVSVVTNVLKSEYFRARNLKTALVKVQEVLRSRRDGLFRIFKNLSVIEKK